MANENRLSELYMGEFGEPAEQQRCKDRINWLCKQVQGPRVLDVGCSQGIASLLIGRAGHEVTGIDVETSALEFARELLRAEPRNVRDRVAFESVDATQIPYEDDSYDSAVLGCVLEHLVDPQAVLREIVRVVHPGGTVAITVPLGFDPFPGSQNSFFLTTFLELIESCFTVTELKFAHGTLFANVENSPPEVLVSSNPDRFAQLVEDFERECLKHQKEETQLLEQWNERYTKLEQANQALIVDHESLRVETTRESAAQADRIHALQLRSEQEQARADSLDVQFQEVESEIRQLSEQLALSQTALTEQKDLNRASNESISRLSQELSEEKAQQRNASELLIEQQAEAAELGTTVARLEAELRSASDRVMVVEKDIGEHKAASASMRENADDLQSKLHQAANALRMSERDLTGLRTTNETLSESVRTLEREREELRSKHAETFETLQAEAEKKRALERDLDRLQHERESLKEEIERLSHEFRLERELFREASQENQGLHVETAVLRTQNSALKEIQSQQDPGSRSSVEEIQSLTVELETTRAQIQKLGLDLTLSQQSAVSQEQAHTEHVKTLAANLSDSKAALKTLQQNHDRKIRLTEQELHTLTRRLDQADSAWTRQRETLKQNLVQTRLLRNQLTDARRQLEGTLRPATFEADLRQAMKKGRESMREQLEAAESAREQLRARYLVDLSNLEEKAADAERSVNLERERVAALQAQTHERSEQMTSLELRLGELEQERQGVEAQLSEQKSYTDRLQALFRKEQADHQKVYESLKRYTDAWEERGRQLSLASASSKERGERLAITEAELFSVKSALSYRIVARINRLLRALHLRKPTLAFSPSLELPEEENVSLKKPIAAAPNFEKTAPAQLLASTPSEGIRTAAILDEFSMACFAPDCAIQTFRTDNWRERLEAEKPELLLVESAWHGNDDSWQYRIASYEKNMGDELQDLIGWCRDHSVPTVFWNKEDPVHYDRFIDSAKRFDVVLTSDARCVDQYQTDIGHSRVHALPFAAQPLIHNPVRTSPRTGEVCFAGSYYANRFEQRREDMDNVLRPALEYGLDIYDRNHGLVIPGTDHFRFPDIYQAAIRGRLEYDEMVEAYRRYRIFLNVNSVKNSRTMFSRRVFELLACGTPVISTPSIGISDLLGDDLVVRADSEEETRRALESLLHDEEEWARKSALGIRKVLAEHTYQVRFEAIQEFAGLGQSNVEPEQVVCITCPNSKDEVDNLVQTLLRQTRRPDQLIILSKRGFKNRWLRAHLESLAQSEIEIHTLDETAFRQRIQACDPNQVLCFLSGHHAYGPQYLADHLQSFAFSPTPVLGKASFFSQSGSTGSPDLIRPDEEHHLVTSAPSATICARRAALDLSQIEELAYAGEPTFEYANIYGGTRFNFCQMSEYAKPGRLSEKWQKTVFV